MPQETIIEGSFIWTLEDAKVREDVLAGRSVTTRGKLVGYAFMAALILALLAFLSFMNRINFRSLFNDPYLIFVSSVAFIILYLFFRYSRSTNLKRGFLQSPDSNRRIEVAFTHDEIIMKTEGVYENKWKWNTIKEVQRNPMGFCFFLAEKTGFWIPIRTFQSQADINALIELAKQLTPKFRVSA